MKTSWKELRDDGTVWNTHLRQTSCTKDCAQVRKSRSKIFKGFGGRSVHYDHVVSLIMGVVLGVGTAE